MNLQSSFYWQLRKISGINCNRIVGLSSKLGSRANVAKAQQFVYSGTYIHQWLLQTNPAICNITHCADGNWIEWTPWDLEAARKRSMQRARTRRTRTRTCLTHTYGMLDGIFCLRTSRAAARVSAAIVLPFELILKSAQMCSLSTNIAHTAHPWRFCTQWSLCLFVVKYAVDPFCNYAKEKWLP